MTTFSKSPNPLQDKFAPVVRALVDEGFFSTLDEEYDLTNWTGVGYSADFLVKTPEGKFFDIEVDYPGQHNKVTDDLRDETLAKGGISTIRISESEVNNGTGEEKIRRLVKQVTETNKILEPGSTRERKLSKINKAIPGNENVGIYLNICLREGGWGWIMQARTQKYSYGEWKPKQTIAESFGSARGAGLKREDIVLRALADQEFWEKLPEGCNLRLFAHLANINSVIKERGIPEGCEISKCNIVSSQKVSRKQFMYEFGTNFSVLASLDPETIALAMDAR